MEEKIPDVIRSVYHGDSLPQALARADFFSPAFLATVEIGVETGSLDRLLDSAADLLELETDAHISRLMALMEPLCMGFLGALTGFVILATAVPLSQMMRLL